jgi:imidazolonepropionase-like amidohydrolase
VADSLGSLEPGELPDIVTVEGNPFDLSDLAARIKGIRQAGQRIR